MIVTGREFNANVWRKSEDDVYTAGQVLRSVKAVSRSKKAVNSGH